VNLDRHEYAPYHHGHDHCYGNEWEIYITGYATVKIITNKE
jgi:hypothetical protein